MARQVRQGKARNKEDGSQNRSRSTKKVSRPRSTEEATRCATTERGTHVGTLAVLNQHQAYYRNAHQDMNRQDKAKENAAHALPQSKYYKT